MSEHERHSTKRIPRRAVLTGLVGGVALATSGPVSAASGKLEQQEKKHMVATMQHIAVPALSSTASYVVYRDTPSSGAYHAQRSDGTEIAVDQNNADPVIQAALDQSFLHDPQSGHGPGDIYIQSGTYSLSPRFTGFNVYSYTRMTLDATARLIVPSGYVGSVFQLFSDDSTEVEHTMIDGGIIGESKPAQQQWTAFLLKASAANQTAGILFNKIANTVIFSAKVGIELQVDASKGFINSNSFEFLRMWGHQTFVDFQIGPPYIAGEQDFGISGNHFFDLQCEVDSTTIAGIHNITGFHNTFLEVKVWDIQVGAAGAKRANIVPQASNTLIIGGILAGGSNVFEDQGVATKILDAL